METEKKIRVLADIARHLNEANITWAVGGSMLLYFKGIVTEFKDIDIMVMEDDAQAVKTILECLGTLEAPKASGEYKSKAFYEFTIDGVDVDVMAGFTIVKDGVVYDCSLKEDEISDFVQLESGQIPLHSLATWRRNYLLMDKPEKVNLIDQMVE